jgi:aspartokinase-like uncharacterized kinase
MPMTHVVKFGGSLFDLQGLGQKLRHWLDALPASRVLLVAGGGALADAIRHADRVHGLGDEASHWLALRAMAVNGQVLSAVLEVSVQERERLMIIDPVTFSQADEGKPGCLPHRWEVTSDSVAARVAEVVEAEVLWILKSCPPPTHGDLEELACLGYVDPYFPIAAARLRCVQFVDFRGVS